MTDSPMHYYASSIDHTHSDTLIRIYYPSLVRYPNAPWLPKTAFYTRGILSFSNRTSNIYPFLYLRLLFAKSNASLHAPLPTKGLQTLQKKHVHIPDTFPIVIFSHGMGGFRGSYSHLCASFAKIGMVVFSIEHNDGSACASDCVDPIGYIQSSNEEHAQYQLRMDQNDIRMNELKNAIEMIHALNTTSYDINGKFIIEKDILMSFSGRLDLSNMFIVGHSYGGATALNFRHEGFKGAIIFDPWMQTVNLMDPYPYPLLSVQSEGFHWRSNINKLQVHHSLTKHATRIIVIKDTAHEDVTDYAIIFPFLMKLMKSRGKRYPLNSVCIWMNECIKFLASVSDHSIFDRYRTEEFVNTTHESVLTDDNAIQHLKTNQKEYWDD